MCESGAIRWHEVADWSEWELRDRLPLEVAGYIVRLRAEVGDDERAGLVADGHELRELLKGTNPATGGRLDCVEEVTYALDDAGKAIKRAAKLRKLVIAGRKRERQLIRFGRRAWARWRADRRRLWGIALAAAGPDAARITAGLLADRAALALARQQAHETGKGLGVAADMAATLADELQAKTVPAWKKGDMVRRLTLLGARLRAAMTGGELPGGMCRPRAKAEIDREERSRHFAPQPVPVPPPFVPVWRDAGGGTFLLQLEPLPYRYPSGGFGTAGPIRCAVATYGPRSAKVAKLIPGNVDACPEAAADAVPYALREAIEAAAG